jgi:uncharacterized protein YndB with AHSA1/START domain
MSLYRQQALIEAPVQEVWSLLEDVDRHPEWWPKVIEVECEGLDEGCDYRMVTQSPVGKVENSIFVERLEGCRELFIRCVNTGTYCRWVLTEARGGTFVDAEFGMEPAAIQHKVFDALAGKRYFRRWVGQSLEALRAAAARAARGRQAA